MLWIHACMAHAGTLLLHATHHVAPLQRVPSALRLHLLATACIRPGQRSAAPVTRLALASPAQRRTALPRAWSAKDSHVLQT